MHKILSIESDTEGYSNGWWVFGREHECTKYCLWKMTQKGTVMGGGCLGENMSVQNIVYGK